MKNKNTAHKALKKQLLSGTIYVALAAVVVAVTVNTTVGILSGKDVKIPDSTPQNMSLDLPSIPDIPKIDIPELSLNLPDNSNDDVSPVSDSPDGIDSVITETPVAENAGTISEIPLIPDDAELGFDKFIKPCDGYVSKEHSADVPVYSTTLSDYRIHIGVDITGEIGTPVCAVNGGIVTDIYDDDLYGKTVCIQNRDGYTVKYSNLLPTVNANISIGSIVTTGQTIGGIGDTALCEAVDASHLHLEIYDKDGTAVDPEDLISF